jgi:hypothetical protein
MGGEFGLKREIVDYRMGIEIANKLVYKLQQKVYGEFCELKPF